MRIIKTSKYVGDSQYIEHEKYIRDANKDITNIVNVLNGRVRFGDGTSGQDGDNMSGQFVQYTSNGTPDTEDTISHTLGVIPIGYIVLWQSSAGSFYQTPTSGTDWTSTRMYLKCSGTSVNALLFLIK